MIPMVLNSIIHVCSEYITIITVMRRTKVETELERSWKASRQGTRRARLSSPFNPHPFCTIMHFIYVGSFVMFLIERHMTMKLKII